jgi:ABC-type multidrug transport system fused ATPase/permease subunit
LPVLNGQNGVKKDLKPIVSASGGRSFWKRVMASPLLGPLLLASIVAWEFGVLLLKASTRPFWYDELLTFYLSGLQPFSLFWRALSAGVDAMPPGYYLIVRIVRMVPGNPLVTLRLPSVFGYVLTLLGVYWFARKRLSVLAGLTAVLLILLSPFRGYAVEARSYALLVGFLTIAAVLWQRMDERRFMTPLFAVSLAFAVACHTLAVVTILIFGLAELMWTYSSHRIRWGFWTACLFATVPFFLSLPLLLNFHRIVGNSFWSRTQWSWLTATYYLYLSVGEYVLVLAVLLGIVIGTSLLLALGNSGDAKSENNFSLPELVLVGGFVFYPALLVVLTRLLNAGYVPRYGWPAIFGLILGFVYLFRSSWAASVQLLIALLIVFASLSIYDFPKASSTTRDTPWGFDPPSLTPNGMEERWMRLNALCRDEPSTPIVIADCHHYLEAVQYSPTELRERLVELFNPNNAIRLVGTADGEREDRLLAQFIPLQVEDLTSFESEHQEFILYSGGIFDWLTRYLIERRYHLTLLAQDGNDSVYMVEK